MIRLCAGRRVSSAWIFGLTAICTTVARAEAEPEETTPPSIVKQVEAVYPHSELESGKDLVVELLVTIDPEGRASAVQVARSGGPPFDEAAAAAVKQWLFDPARRRGVAVASRIHVPVRFAVPVHREHELARDAVTSTAAATRPAGGEVETSTGAVPGQRIGSEAQYGKGHSDQVLEVTVTGRRATPSRGSADFPIDVGILAVVPRKNAADLLQLAPGILLTNEGGEGHAEQVFLRGFDAREGQDIEFSVDGVPINDSGNLHGNGHADTHFIIPELVAALRVVEGPFAPQQGNYAVAGSASYELGLDRRGLTAKASAGSFGTKRVLLTWGPPGASSQTFGGVEIYSTDGFGQNRSADRATAIGQYQGSAGLNGSYRITATGYGTHYKSAGVIRQDDYDSGKKGFFDTSDPAQGGDSSRFSLAADYEGRFDAVSYELQLFLIRRNMRLRENFTGFLLDTQDPLKSLHPERGDLIDLEFVGLVYGSRGKARYKAKLFGLTQEVEIGYFARGDDADSTQYRNQAANDIPYRVDADLHAQLADFGAYADVNVRLLEWLALRGGVRGDLFTFDVLNRCAVHGGIDTPSRPTNDASCLDQLSRGAHREPLQRSSTSSPVLLPRASLILGPVEHVSASFAYGQGVRSIDPIYISQDFNTPFASVRAFEGGLSFAKSFEIIALSARSAVFQTHVNRDLVFNQAEGRNTLADGTTRIGWLAAARVNGSFFDQALNVTVVRSTFDDTHLLVPYVPDLVVRSDTALFHDLPFEVGGEPFRGILGLGVSYVGRRALPYGQRSDVIFVADGSVTLSWRALEVSGLVTNLFARRYRLGEYNYASDFHSAPSATLVPSRHFSAGAPQGVFVTLAIKIGGD